MESDKKTCQDGMITVEAVLSLVPFIIVILGIISIINIYMVHNKVQYALHQMSAELTGYTYFYQALGLRAGDLNLKADIDANTQKLDDAIQDLDSFFSQIDEFEGSISSVKGGNLSGVGDVIDQGKGIYDQGQGLVNTGRELLSDPKALLRGIIYLGVEYAEGEAKSYIVGTAAKQLMNVYLDETFASFGGMTADEYLKRYGVKDGVDGLDFGESELFSSGDYRNIDIVVEYDVEVYILKLFFKNPTISVVQRCTAPAWLDGDGSAYSK